MSRWTWRLNSEGYAARSQTLDGKKRTIYMHRALLDPPSGLVVDHINHDPLDNRRANLRLATPSQNNANSARRENRTGYRGVYPHRQSGRYVAQISVAGRIKSLGLHDTPEAAALAYDRAATQTRIAFARLNFPPAHASSVPSQGSAPPERSAHAPCVGRHQRGERTFGSCLASCGPGCVGE